METTQAKNSGFVSLPDVYCPWCYTLDIELKEELIFCPTCNVYVGKVESFQETFVNTWNTKRKNPLEFGTIHSVRPDYDRNILIYGIVVAAIVSLLFIFAFIRAI